MALSAGVDYLWIGARTSANPIAVQEIADTITDQLRLTEYRPASPDRIQTDFPLKGILVKNPVSEDAALWLGNIERIEQTGVPVMAVHRGCNHRPCWAMAHAVRLAKPELPLLIDPSHMSGDADLIQGLLNKASALDYDGSMIEVHCCPEQALSDAKQQLSPSDVPLTIYKSHGNNAGITRKSRGNAPTNNIDELLWLRAEIDELDERLWDTIAARMDVSRRIGEWKKANGVAPLQPERYGEIVESIKLKVERLGLSQDFALQIWERLHEESLKKQLTVDS